MYLVQTYFHKDNGGEVLTDWSSTENGNVWWQRCFTVKWGVTETEELLVSINLF